MVGSESVSAMMRNRDARWKLAPLTRSVAKCEAVEALHDVQLAIVDNDTPDALALIDRALASEGQEWEPQEC